MQCIFSESELCTLCAEWQERLRLQHWTIAVGISSLESFEQEEAQGEIQFSIETGRALIKILDPEKYPESPFKQDMEVSLVHELLHLMFAPFTPKEGTLQHSFMENSIETLAQVLVESKRKEEVVS